MMRHWILLLCVWTSVSSFAGVNQRVVPMEILPILIASMSSLPRSAIYQEIMLYFSGEISQNDLSEKARRSVRKIQETYDWNQDMFPEPEEPLVLVSTHRSTQFSMPLEELPSLFQVAPGLRQYIPEQNEIESRDRTFLVPVSPQTLYLLNQIRLGHNIEEWLMELQNSSKLLKEIHSDAINLDASELEKIVGDFLKSIRQRVAPDTVFIQLADREVQTTLSILSPPDVDSYFTPYMNGIFNFEEWVEYRGRKYPRLFFPDILFDEFKPIYRSLVTKEPLEPKRKKKLSKVIYRLGYQDYFFPKPHCGETVKLVINGLAFRFSAIPDGRFTMGSPDSEKDRHDNEIQRNVSINAFFMQITPVTRYQWNVIFDNPMEANDETPITKISYDEIQEFIKRLNILLAESDSDMFEFYLPSEEEWEYAARAGSQATYPWGEDASLLHKFAWCSDDDSRMNPRKVGLLEPNAWGLYDMLGNIHEFTRNQERLILKGGAYHANSCRPAYRGTYFKTGQLVTHEHKLTSGGFRLAARIR